MNLRHFLKKKKFIAPSEDSEKTEPVLPTAGPSPLLHLHIVNPGKYVTWNPQTIADKPRVHHVWELKKPNVEGRTFEVGSGTEVNDDNMSEESSTVSGGSIKYDDPMLNVMWKEVKTERHINALVDYKLEQDRKAWATAHYKLTSLEGKGDAELIRLLFVCAGEPFEDERLTVEQWEELKPSTPYFSLPLLSKCGKQWGNTGAIVRVLARRFLLMGVTNDEHLVVEAAYERLRRLKRQNERAITWVITGEKNKERQEWARSQMLHVVLPPAMKEWEHLITQTRGPFVVASGMTMADIAIMDFLDQCSSCMMIDSLFSDYLAVADLFSIVRSSQKISDYLGEKLDD